MALKSVQAELEPAPSDVAQAHLKLCQSLLVAEADDCFETVSVSIHCPNATDATFMSALLPLSVTGILGT